jgi:acid phosphatase type 7
VLNPHTYGVLKLTLYRSSYDWKFVPAGDKTFTDSGNTPCHNQGGSQKD